MAKTGPLPLINHLFFEQVSGTAEQAGLMFKSLNRFMEQAAQILANQN
jgi:hypothetical protein